MNINIVVPCIDFRFCAVVVETINNNPITTVTSNNPGCVQAAMVLKYKFYYVQTQFGLSLPPTHTHL